MVDPGTPEDSARTGALQVHLVSLFPTIFESWLKQGVVSRAIERGVARVQITDVRSFGVGRHRVTDDYSFGGGTGMVMKPEPIFAAVESLDPPPGTPIILLTPHGRTFDHFTAERLSRLAAFVLIAGHYEGVDQRVAEHLATEEISIGDFVLSAGEIAAMAVTDAVVRLLPGAISEGGAEVESFISGLLEYPQYTRPARFREWEVPEVLLSGNHAQVELWRHEQAVALTSLRRPDLLQRDERPAEKL